MIDTDRPVLVTGAAGFIGAKVVELLLESGQSVVGVDNLNDYYDVKLKNYRINSLLGQAEPHQRVALSEVSERLAKADLSSESLSFYQADIEDKESVDALFGRHEFKSVLNLAARAGVRYSMENPHVYMTTNAIGSLNLLEGMRNNDVKKMVLASTSSLYAGQEMPFVETLPVNTPISPYAASKKAAEVMAYSYHNLYGLDVSVVRYFTVFGPCGRPDMCMFRFAEWVEKGEPIELFGDGEQSRDFTYVDDIAKGTIAAQKEIGYEVINLGGGLENSMSLKQLSTWSEDRFGPNEVIHSQEERSMDAPWIVMNASLAKESWDWKPQTSLYEILDEIAQHAETHPQWLNSTK